MNSTMADENSANIEIIEINDDDYEEEQLYRKNIDSCSYLIDLAILVQNLDNMKKAIFTCLKIINNPKLNMRTVDQNIRKSYIQFFQSQLKLDISRAFHRSPVQVYDNTVQTDKTHIIVHGVDFLSNAQLERKFKGKYPIKIQRINASNASIIFNEAQNVPNVLDMLNTRKNPQQIKGKFNWNSLANYRILDFKRPLKYRYAAINETKFQKEEYSLINFEASIQRIQQSDLFITCQQDKKFYDTKIKQFEENVSFRRSKHQRAGFAIRGFQRSRTRNQRNVKRKNFNIDQFGRKFNNRSQPDSNNRDARNNQTLNFTDQRGIYQTKRNNVGGDCDFVSNYEKAGPIKRGNCEDRQNKDRNNFRSNDDRYFNYDRENKFFKKNDQRMDEQNIAQMDISYDIPIKSVSQLRSNSSRFYKANFKNNNDRYFNHDRENRFFKKNDQRMDISYEIPMKSVSRSISNSSRSYNVAQLIQIPFNPVNMSISFALPQKTQVFINQDGSLNYASNQPINNSIMNTMHEVTKSFILQNSIVLKQEADENRSNIDLQNILNELQREEIQKVENKNKKRQNSSHNMGNRKNSCQKNRDNNQKKTNYHLFDHKKNQVKPKVIQKIYQYDIGF